MPFGKNPGNPLQSKQTHTHTHTHHHHHHHSLCSLPRHFEGWSLFPLWGLPSRVAQHRTHLGLSVCLFVLRTPEYFTEWHMHRLQTQMPSVFFQRRSKGVPEKTSFNQPVDAFSGTRFLSHFFDFCAIFCPRLGSAQRGRTALRVQSSIKVVFGRKIMKFHEFSLIFMHFHEFS